MIKQEQNKNVLLQKFHFLKGKEHTTTEIIIKYANKEFSFKAYNLKIHFSLDEFLQTIKVLSQVNSKFFQLFIDIQQSNTDEVEIYYISQALLYYQEIFIYYDNQIYLIDEYQRLQKLDSKHKILKEKKRKLTLSNFYQRKIIQTTKFQPLTIIKLEQDYCILYQTNNEYYLKYNQSKRISNKLKIIPLISQKFEKINKDNFYEIFSIKDDQLQYSDYISNLCSSVKEIKIDKKYLYSVIRIQRFVLYRQFKFKLSIIQYKRKKQILWRKSFIWEDSAFQILIQLNQDKYNNQKILIDGKQIDHSLGRYIQGLQQILFLQYDLRDILITTYKMIQQVQIVHQGPNLRLRSQQFDQIYGQIFQYDNLDKEQTLDYRIAKSNSYRNKYLQNSFIDHLSNHKPTDNALDKQKIKKIFNIFYFTYLRHKLSTVIKYTQNDIRNFPIKFLDELEAKNLNNFEQQDDNTQSLEIQDEQQNKQTILQYQTIDNESEFNHYIIFEANQIQNYSYKVIIHNSKVFLKEFKFNFQSSYLFHKLILQCISNMKFITKMIETVTSINSLLIQKFITSDNNITQEIIRNIMMQKIQRRVRFFLLIQQYRQKNSNILLRVSYLFSQNQFYKLIFRFKKNKIRILYQKQLAILDLAQLANSYTLSKQQQTIYQISNFSLFLNIKSSRNQDDYRFKLSKLINFLESIIKIRNNSLYFALKLPIVQTKYTRVQQKSQAPKEIFISKITIIQRYYRQKLVQNFFKLLKKSNLMKNQLQYRCIRKIRGKYYLILCFDLSPEDIQIKIIQYKDTSNFLQKSFKFNQSNFINFQQNTKHQFLANSIDLIEGEIQIILDNFQIQNSKEEQIQDNCYYQTLQDNRYQKQIRSRLINSKREQNVLYNVVYSNKKIINSSYDSILININLKSMRNVYHSEDKHTLIKHVAETSLNNIKYENNHLKVNVSKIIPEKLKISQNPRFKVCEKILKPKAQMEIIHKSIYRFEQQKYLLQIQFLIEQAKSILPIQKDNYFGMFQTEYKIVAINIKTKKEITWNLTYENAIDLTCKTQKDEITQTIIQHLSLLNDRFLFITNKTKPKFETVVYIKLSCVHTIQRICRTRKFNKNYQTYKLVKKANSQILLHTKYQDCIIIISSSTQAKFNQSIWLFMWDLQNFKMKKIEIQLQKYLHFWNISPKAFAKALLYFVILTNDRIFFKKYNEFEFQHKFETFLN